MHSMYCSLLTLLFQLCIVRFYCLKIIRILRYCVTAVRGVCAKHPFLSMYCCTIHPEYIMKQMKTAQRFRWVGLSDPPGLGPQNMNNIATKEISAKTNRISVRTPADQTNSVYLLSISLREGASSAPSLYHLQWARILMSNITPVRILPPKRSSLATFTLAGHTSL